MSTGNSIFNEWTDLQTRVVSRRADGVGRLSVGIYQMVVGGTIPGNQLRGDQGSDQSCGPPGCLAPSKLVVVPGDLSRMLQACDRCMSRS